MIVDKRYCMSSFLMSRSIVDDNKAFSDTIKPKHFSMPGSRTAIINSKELETALSESVQEATKDGKAALALSGGIDSAILAKFMPKGGTAYTFKCIVPGIDVTDETHAAAKYAEECGLEHRIVEIFWDDFEELTPVLMKHKGAPIHSIEVQILKAAKQIKRDGFNRLIFGESADCIYGGLNNVLSKDWTIGDFIERYSYVMPYRAIKEFDVIAEPFHHFEKNGYAMVHEFFSSVFFRESVNLYDNACHAADIEKVLPYAMTYLNSPLDYERVRNGEYKYLVREVFSKLYHGFEIPPKVPMPRPMNEWLKEWNGPVRPEFWPHCTDSMTGDQKWLVWALERFLNMLDGV